MSASITIPGLGAFPADAGLHLLERTSDGRFCVGRDGVEVIATPTDRRVEFVAFEDRTLAYVTSTMGYGAYYPVHPVRLDRPVRAVLMDLDGTTVRSEHFWVWMIEMATASLLARPGFQLEAADLPYVSGFSVSEHLQVLHPQVPVRTRASRKPGATTTNTRTARCAPSSRAAAAPMRLCRLRA